MGVEEGGRGNFHHDSLKEVRYSILRHFQIKSSGIKFQHDMKLFFFFFPKSHRQSSAVDLNQLPNRLIEFFFISFFLEGERDKNIRNSVRKKYDFAF